MRVEEVMSKATGCRQGDTVQNCARMMKEQNIGFVPICDAQGKPIGAVTDRDLAVRVLADGRGANEKIDAFMTKEIVSCRIGDDVGDAERERARGQRRERVVVRFRRHDGERHVPGLVLDPVLVLRRSRREPEDLAVEPRRLADVRRGNPDVVDALDLKHGARTSGEA
jgi:CBS domain-containing protein